MASLQRKTPYNLISPSLNRVALIAASNVLEKPYIIAEVSDLLGISVVDLLSRTLRSTLPCLVVNGETEVIQAIADRLGNTAGRMIVSGLGDILPRAFLQPSWEQTDKALAICVELVRSDVATDDSHTEVITTLINVDVMHLLSELVTSLGAEDESERIDVRRFISDFLF
jgi:serine/threonine-protein kinase ATR